MFVLGLTGSIAMGKTWGAKCFRHFGIPVHDADACVHDLLAPGGAAVEDVARLFDGVKNAQGGIDRQKLGARVFAPGGEADLQALEALLHPRVVSRERAFLARHARWGTRLVVLDIPLLFETHARPRVDAVASVSAPAFLQRQRVMRRAGMTPEKYHAILARQVPDGVKRAASEFVVSTGGTRGESLRQIAEVVKVAGKRKGDVWSPHWGLGMDTGLKSDA